MENNKLISKVYSLSKYSNYYLLLTFLLGVILVFTTPLLGQVEQYSNILTSVQTFLEYLTFSWTETLANILSVISDSSGYASTAIIIIGLVIVIFSFLVILIVQLITHRLIKKEQKLGTSINRRIFTLMLQFVNTYLVFGMLFNSTLQTFIGLDFILILMLLVLFVVQVYSIYLTIVDTYENYKLGLYKQKLHFVGILKFILVVILILLALNIVITAIAYILINNFVTSINYYDLFLIDDLITSILNFIKDLVSNVAILGSASDLIESLLENDLISGPARTFVLEGSFNSFIQNSLSDFVSSIFVPKLTYLFVGLIPTVGLSYTTFKIESKLKDEKFIYIHLLLSVLTILFLFFMSPIVFSIPLGIIILIFTFTHFYEFVTKYGIFNVRNIKKLENKEEDGINE